MVEKTKPALKQEPLGDKPIEPGLVAVMNALGHDLDDIFNQGKRGDKREVGFILMVFPFSSNQENERCNYISNARREDVIILLREQLARFEGSPDTSGKA